MTFKRQLRVTLNVDEKQGLLYMDMNALRAEQIARIIEHTQDAYNFFGVALYPGNEERTVASILTEIDSGNSYGALIFGFSSLALIYAFDCVVVPLEYPTDIISEIDIEALGVTQNILSTRDRGNAQIACFRHLRNCFAHCQFSYTVVGTTTTVKLTDRNNKDTLTFTATCEVQAVMEIAKNVLNKAYDALEALTP